MFRFAIRPPTGTQGESGHRGPVTSRYKTTGWPESQERIADAVNSFSDHKRWGLSRRRATSAFPESRPESRNTL